MLEQPELTATLWRSRREKMAVGIMVVAEKMERSRWIQEIYLGIIDRI